MKSYLQSLTTIATVFTGVLIIFFYSFFGKVSGSNQVIHMNQSIEEARRTDFSQITRILDRIYIGSVISFLLIVYFLVPR